MSNNLLRILNLTKDKLRGVARQNPKRAAAAVSAAVIRGNRTGGADPAEVKNLKAEVKRLNKVISDNQKMATQQDCSELSKRVKPSKIIL